MDRDSTMNGMETFTDLGQIIVKERNTKATEAKMTRFLLETMPSCQYEADMGELYSCKIGEMQTLRTQVRYHRRMESRVR